MSLHPCQTFYYSTAMDSVVRKAWNAADRNSTLRLSLKHWLQEGRLRNRPFPEGMPALQTRIRRRPTHQVRPDNLQFLDSRLPRIRTGRKGLHMRRHKDPTRHTATNTLPR